MCYLTAYACLLLFLILLWGACFCKFKKKIQSDLNSLHSNPSNTSELTYECRKILGNTPKITYLLTYVCVNRNCIANVCVGVGVHNIRPYNPTSKKKTVRRKCLSLKYFWKVISKQIFLFWPNLHFLGLFKLFSGTYIQQ